MKKYKCIAMDAPELEFGKIYEVYNHDGDWILIKDESGYEEYRPKSYFEEVNENKLRKWRLPDGRILEPDLFIWGDRYKLTELLCGIGFNDLQYYTPDQYQGKETDFTITLKYGTTIKAELIEENMKSVKNKLVKCIVDAPYLTINNRYEVHEENENCYCITDDYGGEHWMYKIIFEEIEEHEYQDITPENIIEVLEYNGFNKYSNSYNLGEIWFSFSRNSSYYFARHEHYIRHNNLNKVLDFMSEFIELKRLPKIEIFEEWFEKNKLEGFVYMFNTEFKYPLYRENDFVGYIYKSWPLEKQKQVCKQLMLLYK